MTIEERARDYAKMVETDYPAIVAHDYESGAREEHILLTEWHTIEEDMFGMASDRAYEELVDNLPILVKEVDTENVYAINRTEIIDWSGDLCHHPRKYVWRKIHK